MKFRVDSDIYVSESSRTLTPGMIVGDGCLDTDLWRYPDTTANPALRGQPRPPSSALTPLDDEAKKMFAEAFPDPHEERDPLKKIPITTDKRDAAGHHVQSTPAEPYKEPTKPAAVKTPATGENVTKDPSVATEKVAGPGKA